MKGNIKSFLVCLVSLLAISCVFILMVISLKEDIKQNNITISTT